MKIILNLNYKLFKKKYHLLILNNLGNQQLILPYNTKLIDFYWTTYFDDTQIFYYNNIYMVSINNQLLVREESNINLEVFPLKTKSLPCGPNLPQKAF